MTLHHLIHADKLVERTGRTMLLFDLLAGKDELRAAQAILAEERSFAKLDADWDVFAGFRIAIAPYDFRAVYDDFALRRKLWCAGVVSIDPERNAALLPAAPAAAAVSYGAAFDIESALHLGKVHHGENIKVAVLDTGFDIGHKDYTHRTVIARGIGHFLDGRDDHGHGTICAGLACGPRPYGIADKAVILAGRIYSKTTSPTEGQVLRGLRWARRRRAEVVTLSLNWRPYVSEPSPQLERAGRLMLANGCLVIASAAQSSGCVTPPADCNSIMAIGSVGGTLAVSSTSPSMVAGRDPVDAVGYGENLFSSCLHSGHCITSGNSMAAAVAGGIAALWAGADAQLRGAALWQAMVDNATTVRMPNALFKAVGAGLLMPPP